MEIDLERLRRINDIVGYIGKFLEYLHKERYTCKEKIRFYENIFINKKILDTATHMQKFDMIALLTLINTKKRNMLKPNLNQNLNPNPNLKSNLKQNQMALLTQTHLLAIVIAIRLILATCCKGN